MLRQMVGSIGHDVSCAHTLKDGLHEALSHRYDVVLLDVMLPDGNGLDALPEIQRAESSPEVIIMTGLGDPDGAELAIRNGAWDYVQKPLSLNQIILPLRRVLQYRDDVRKAQRPAVALKLDGIVGTGAQMKSCFDSLAHAANNMINDFFDLEGGVDTDEYARAQYAPHPILSGMISKNGLLLAIVIVTLLDAILMLYFYFALGTAVLVFALVGFFISVFY